MTDALFQILAILRSGPMDAGGILDALRTVGNPDEVPSIPTFYRHLRKAADAGWLAIEGHDDPGDGPGRPKRHYALTRQGREAVEAKAATLSRFTRLALGGDPGGRAG